MTPTRGGRWRLRGKLDVPKERCIGYPHCETESDQSLVVGWVGTTCSSSPLNTEN